MKEKNWGKYALVTAASFLFLLDLGLLWNSLHHGYKDIIGIHPSFFVIVLFILFCVWFYKDEMNKLSTNVNANGNQSLNYIAIGFLFIGVMNWLTSYNLIYQFIFSITLGYWLYYYGVSNWFPKLGKRGSACLLCILSVELILILAFPIMIHLKPAQKGEELLNRMGYTDIQYRTNANRYGLSWIFPNSALGLSNQELKTDLYLFTAVRQGKQMGILISPVTGKIIAQAPLLENEVLKLLSQDESRIRRVK
ncbi:hypothetical protein [Holdemania massiliensis]|uniref:hypothetical protein n=1 Tax=Holdemania massiliensis TaxID=1468449 RepID=UPI001F06AB96|nr:hypothetical protein [Holdemania massiliensis]MCH1941751.1 hypothetical protein [Holdemania massiliensis]